MPGWNLFQNLQNLDSVHIAAIGYVVAIGMKTSNVVILTKGFVMNVHHRASIIREHRRNRKPGRGIYPDPDPIPDQNFFI